MTDLDPRLTPARGDLAAEHLRGTIEAENYVPALSMRIAVGSAPLRAESRPDAAQLTEAIFGEPVAVYDLHEGWAWVQLETDRYVGWLPEWALGPVAGEPTHRVSALRTFIFPGAEHQAAAGRCADPRQPRHRRAGRGDVRGARDRRLCAEATPRAA